MNVAMLVKKIIDSITCWAKNKSNCTNVLSSIIVVYKKKSTMKNKTFTQFDLFLAQQWNSIYSLSLAITATHELSCCS